MRIVSRRGRRRVADAISTAPPQLPRGGFIAMTTAVVLAPSIVLLDARAASRVHTAGLIRNRWPDARLGEAADLDGALAEAGELARAAHPPELILVDLADDTQAREAARALRERHPRAQVALVGSAGRASGGVRRVAGPLTGDGVERLLALAGWAA